MKGFIEVYDQRTQFLKDIFLSHGYQINDNLKKYNFIGDTYEN